MYSVYELNDLKLEELLLTPGLLLIDEAENHLHPKWQKTFLNSILNIFPNLQIIITTHSPFIVSSVENSKVFVCKSEKDHSIIVDETDFYSNKPIDEQEKNCY
jgi:predicted ATP-binding protein involved in virulence